MIEADSISLASLSESPPSEFKFSDDENDHLMTMATLNEEIIIDSNHHHQHMQIHHQLSQHLDATKKSTTSTITSSSTSNTQIKDFSKNIQIQQAKLNQLIEIRNRKKAFHAILLNDAKLNNLKEILVEIKQRQEKFGHKAANSASSSSASSSSACSSAANSTTSSSSCSNSTSSVNSPQSSSSSALNESLRESVERLCQFLFDFLKQGMKPLSPESLHQSTNLLRSSTTVAAESPIMSVNKLAESNILAVTFSQYTQLWNLIEQTINLNLTLIQNFNSAAQSAASSTSNGSNASLSKLGSFNLPKEAYLNMFQEINRYSNTTNQTYLIDNSSVNTSQLRRKHHFMVMLMSLKFKFQLFIVNLLK